jgi:hypothetical protein
MPKTISSYTKKEIEKMIDNKLNPHKKYVDDIFNKLNKKIVDIMDIQRVLIRK